MAMLSLFETQVVALAEALTARGAMLVTAESCTGGLIAAACTARAGSSDWFHGGLVSYSNAAKSAWLHVPAALIDTHGAVSEPVARAMAEGALAASDAQFSVAVTGIAGPGGGSATKPVGTVWLAWGVAGGATQAAVHVFPGDRDAVREATVQCALAGVLRLVQGEAA